MTNVAMLQVQAGQVLGHGPGRWLAALGVTLAVFAALWIVKKVLLVRLEKFAAATDNKLDDIVADTLARTHLLFIAAVALYAGSFLLSLGKWGPKASQAMTIVTILQGGRWASAALASLIRLWKEERGGEAALGSTALAANVLGKTLIISLMVLLVMDNLGIKVSALLAGLGVGGIAIALAVQKILGDLFASLSIMLDRPFEIGDVILVGDMSGTVEHIGLKTTRVRSVSGEQLVFANSDLLGSRIRNFKRMSERRVLFNLAVPYGTDLERLKEIPGWIRAAVEAHDKTRFDRAHLQRLGEAVVFEAVYWVTEPDFALHMDIQQAVNLELLARFQAAGVAFALPARTVHLQDHR